MSRNSLSVAPVKRLIIEWKTAGYLSSSEASRWQNEREALAVHHALRTFWSELVDLARDATTIAPLRVLILQDNAAVVSYIRKQGGSRRNLSILVEEFVKECFCEKIHLMAEWIPGSDMPADVWSRQLALQDRADWAVSWKLFHSLCQRFTLLPTLDLFASRVNAKCKRYFSFRPDPFAMGMDALSDDKDWSIETAYAAPPPHLIPRCLAKIRRDKATVLMIVPHWPEGPWWQTFRNMRISTIFPFPINDSNIIKGFGENPQKLGKEAVAAVLSGISL